MQNIKLHITTLERKEMVLSDLCVCEQKHPKKLSHQILNHMAFKNEGENMDCDHVLFINMCYKKPECRLSI